jgi:pyruvate,orthophosphate dikinase
MGAGKKKRGGKGGEHRVYLIGAGSAIVPGASPEEMGFKAYNLARMAAIGMPVPAAFVLSTAFCRDYYAAKGALPEGFRDLLRGNLRELERMSGLSFGGERRPLLVSVRSGAPVSMPGMLETVLNVGLNDATVAGLVRMTGNPRLAWDSYRQRAWPIRANSISSRCANSPPSTWKFTANSPVKLSRRRRWTS